MKKTIILFAVAISSVAAFAQKKTTTSGTIAFDATTPTDDLPKAENKTVIAAIDTKKGTVSFEALIKSFTFGNPMMQEHFNGPKWINSEKNPTATFKGTITNVAEVNFAKDGTYTANLEGDLSLHGETSKVNTTATIVVAGNLVNTTSSFTVKLADYKLSNAGGKLADEPKITVSAELK